MRTVQHILDSKTKPFNTVTPDTRVIDAINLLNSVNLSYLVVMSDDAYKGIFSERDYSRNVILKGRTSATTTVAEVMTTDLPIVTTADTVDTCINLINTFKTRYLLAYDKDRQFAGVITIHDLLRQVISNKEGDFNTAVTNHLIDQAEGNAIY